MAKYSSNKHFLVVLFHFGMKKLQTKSNSVQTFRKVYTLFFYMPKETNKKTVTIKGKTVVATQKKSSGAVWSLASALNYAKQTVRIDKNTFFNLYKRNADIRQAINKIPL